jgi:hypothetical protein
MNFDGMGFDLGRQHMQFYRGHDNQIPLFKGRFAMKNRLCFVRPFVLLISFILAIQSCKKDDNPATPAPTSPTGAFSFATDSGNFSASGSYNLAATSGSGAGWYDASTIAAYYFNSATSVSVVVLHFMTTPGVASYQFPSTASTAWTFNATSMNTTGARLHTATSGTLNITAHAGGITQGNFSGAGCVVPAPTHTFSITNGAFNINSGTGKRGMALPEDVNRIVRMMMERMEQ